MIIQRRVRVISTELLDITIAVPDNFGEEDGVDSELRHYLLEHTTPVIRLKEVQGLMEWKHKDSVLDVIVYKEGDDECSVGGLWSPGELDRLAASRKPKRRPHLPF